MLIIKINADKHYNLGDSMGLGKVLGFAALGVAAVAAAPFTGGGSILGAASLGASLAGAGTVAAAIGAGAVGATVGKKLADGDKKEKDDLVKENIKLSIKADKFKKAFEEAIARFQGDKEYFNYIIASTAIGISMANADGEIDKSEREELDEFIGGVASSNYPEHIKEIIQDLYDKPRNFNTALKYLEKVDSSNYESIRDILEVVMEADGDIHDKERAFLKAFDSAIKKLIYSGEIEDNENQFLLGIKEKIVA